ncbi:MAG: DUF4202 domain-containing protein [Bacteroidota bacterium]|nr:DUF4202 domain-containing protein [Bacteroidota bacterium]
METITDKFKAAITLFDAANSEDPHLEVHDGKEYPKELLYALRMTEWLERLTPDASEVLRLAARCQHIHRWKIPRERYPMDRKGYHLWRTTLKKYHSDTAGAILQEVGYDQHTINRVKTLLLKEKLKADPEVQLLEDVICLVFLDYYFKDFVKKHEEEKLVEIISRTWKKMSPTGHEAALKLQFSPEEALVIKKALQ